MPASLFASDFVCVELLGSRVDPLVPARETATEVDVRTLPRTRYLGQFVIAAVVVLVPIVARRHRVRLVPFVVVLRNLLHD